MAIFYAKQSSYISYPFDDEMTDHDRGADKAVSVCMDFCIAKGTKMDRNQSMTYIKGVI
jgi:hypothetical protein